MENPEDPIGVRALSVDSLTKFPMLFNNVILLLQNYQPEADNCSEFGPILAFESELIENITVTFSKNFKPGSDFDDGPNLVSSTSFSHIYCLL